MSAHGWQGRPGQLDDGLGVQRRLGQPCSPAQLALIKDLVGYGERQLLRGRRRLHADATRPPRCGSPTAAPRPTTTPPTSPPARRPRATRRPRSIPAWRRSSTGVASTFPVNGATDFPINANLTVTFSEPVNVTTLVVHARLLASAARSRRAFSGGPTTFTLDPGIALTNGETCTLTVLANQVSDQDANDPPDNMVFNFVVGFTAFDVCVAPYTPIYTIQGSGLSTPIPGTVTTKGVVVGDFEGTAASIGLLPAGS